VGMASRMACLVVYVATYTFMTYRRLRLGLSPFATPIAPLQIFGRAVVYGVPALWQ
jgi:hypothetical protein